MSDLSASRAEPSASSATSTPSSNTMKILVWDVPVRVFHWLMVLSFAGAYITAESERWRLLHVTLGYTMAALVVFRIVWGIIGSKYARFSSFVRGPKAVARYIGAMLRGQPEHHVGHNPAGALAIVALLLLSLAVAASGWAIFNELAGKWAEEVHEIAANLMLAIVAIHVAGVIIASRLHHENLVGAMLTGRKLGTPDEGIRSAWRGVAALMVIAVLGFWWQQWQSTPSGAQSGDRPAISAQTRQHLGDDD